MNIKTDVFTYGSLMHPLVWQRIVKGSYASSPGFVEGFSRKKVANEPYPGMVRTDGKSRVDGIIYFGIVEEDIARLDDFEGDWYERVQITCALEEGGECECETYLFRFECKHLLSDEDWRPELFDDACVEQLLRTAYSVRL